MTLTVVTALYDLAAREANPRRRTVADYLGAGEFLFGLDVDLVAFGDEGPVAEVEARRRAAGLGERTRAVPLALEELHTYALVDRIAAARAAEPVVNANADKDSPLYVCMQWGKFELLERAGALDPFAGSHLAWIDLGLPGRPHPADDVFGHPAEGVRLLMMRPFGSAELELRRELFSHLRGHLAAGYISGDRKRMLRLADLFRRVSMDVLDAGFAPSEEQLLPLLYEIEPELFEFYHGDYADILGNYERVRAGAGNLLFQLRVARDAGLTERGLEICQAVIASQRDRTLECGSDQLAELLDECFLAAWFGGEDSGRPLAHEIADTYRERVRVDPEFRDVFLRDEIRVRSNFELLSSA